MYIGEVSNKTGLSIKAIRLYEEKGLIPKPRRSGRYRVYQDSDIDILLLIKEAKSFGVTLAQLKTVIEYNQGEIDWNDVHAFLMQQKKLILEQIDSLHDKIRKIDLCASQINTCPQNS